MTTTNLRPQQVWIRYWPLDFPSIYEIRITRLEREHVWGVITDGAGYPFPTGKELLWPASVFVTFHRYVRDEATIHDRLLSDEPFRLKPEPAPPPKTLHQLGIEEIQAEEDREFIKMCDAAYVKAMSEAPPAPPDFWDHLAEDSTFQERVQSRCSIAIGLDLPGVYPDPLRRGLDGLG